MTERAEIERLLNETGFTLEGLPELYSMKQCEEAIRRSGLTVGMAGNMICHQSDVIERLVNALRSALDLAPKWISVEDKKPKDWERVLVYIRHRNSPDDGYRDVLIKSWSERYGWNMGDNYYEITHWMPLPEPPKEG